MEVKDFQNKIVEFAAQWDRKRNVSPNQSSTFVHLVEEVGELATQYVNRESRKDRYNEKEVENAIGDIFMQLTQLAHLHNLDIEDVVTTIIKEEQKVLQQ